MILPFLGVESRHKRSEISAYAAARTGSSAEALCAPPECSVDSPLALSSSRPLRPPSSGTRSGSAASAPSSAALGEVPPERFVGGAAPRNESEYIGECTALARDKNGFFNCVSQRYPEVLNFRATPDWRSSVAGDMRKLSIAKTFELRASLPSSEAAPMASLHGEACARRK
jgi:hypothetical protein